MTRALVVVAHPDDETIWCGGTILMRPDWEWTIASLCRKHDKDRAPKFRKVCRQLKAKCFISDLEDEQPEKSLKSLDGVKSRILRMLRRKSFDFIFTHGCNGEYGHNRHCEVHRAVKELLCEGKLRCKKIFCFNYKLSASGTFCVPNTRSATLTTRLSEKIARQKDFLITSTYGFNSGGFEQRSAQRVESFREQEVMSKK